MTQVFKIALPGYNADTDTDPDHFSLFVDGQTDRVLIKEFTRGSITVGSSEVEITHNLGYIPLFFVYVNKNYIVGAEGWITPLWPALSVDYYIYADTSKVYLNNVTGIDTTFKYYIFYDNQVGNSAQTIAESRNVFKIAKIGKNAKTSKDPNDYIFHSDLNTFKIVKEAVTSVSVTGSGGSFSVAHGQSGIASYAIFFKFPDGVVIRGDGQNTAKTQSIFNIYIDDTDINFQVFNSPSASYTLNLKYYIFETPLA